MDTKEYRFDTDIYKSDTDNMYKPIREYKQWTCVQLSTNSWAYAEQTACTVLFSSAQTHVQIYFTYYRDRVANFFFFFK